MIAGDDAAGGVHLELLLELRSRSPERLADELKKLSEAVLWKNHRATDELKDAVKLVAAELSRTADTLRQSAPALEALREDFAGTQPEFSRRVF